MTFGITHNAVQQNAMLQSEVDYIVNQSWNQAMSVYVDNAASPLRKDVHERIAAEVIQVKRETLFAVQDILDAGLIAPADMHTTLYTTETLNEFRDAIQTMGEVTDENNDTTFLPKSTPLPITHSGFSIQVRQNVGNKQNLGAGESTRTVSKKLDDQTVNGSTIVAQSNGITGYMNTADRLTDTISDWSDFATNGDLIVPEATALFARLSTETFAQIPNSVMMYISPDLEGSFNSDYSSLKGDDTIRTRLMKVIPLLKDIKTLFALPAKTTVLVEMASRTVQMISASNIQVIPHINTKGILSTQKFTTFAMMAPLFNGDRNGTLSVLSANPSGGS